MERITEHMAEDEGKRGPIQTVVPDRHFRIHAVVRSGSTRLPPGAEVALLRKPEPLTYDFVGTWIYEVATKSRGDNALLADIILKFMQLEAESMTPDQVEAAAAWLGSEFAEDLERIEVAGDFNPFVRTPFEEIDPPLLATFEPGDQSPLDVATRLVLVREKADPDHLNRSW